MHATFDGFRFDRIDDLPIMDLPRAMLLPGSDPGALAPMLSWLAPDHYTPASDMLHLAGGSFLLRFAGRCVLIDTCVGCGKPRPARPAWHDRQDDGFLRRLSAAGVAPEQVDTVLCTHLHADHVGWNTRLRNGRWVPTFPNARYLLGRTELAHWQAEAAARGMEAVNHGSYADSVLPVIAAGQADLVDDGYELAAGLVLRPLPGHTPGQMGLVAERTAGTVLFCGDAIHSPAQVARPDWSTAFCASPIGSAGLTAYQGDKSSVPHGRGLNQGSRRKGARGAEDMR